jgi:tRNA pseudouridine38-40 synthase
MEFTCGEPFVRDELEWVLVRIKGQSFMLHQIRKMIGLCIGLIRGFASIDVMDKAFRMERVDVPIAPGLGLMLEEVHYDYYNERYGKDGMHDSLDWLAEKEKVEAFRDAYIYPDIVKGEKEEKS